MEIWFDKTMLGVINTETWLIEPEFNSIKVTFKT
jgi:hypothetical protein